MSISHNVLTLAIVSLFCAVPTLGLNTIPSRSSLLTTDYDAFYDFSFENLTHEVEGVSVFEPFTYAGCRSKGTLKISLAETNGNWHRRRVLIDMVFSSPRGWAFNIGNSPTSRGSGGDGGSSSNDAELVFNHGFVTAYLNQNARNRRLFRLSDLISKRLTVIVGDHHIVWLPDDIRRSNFLYSQNFFALNGQSDIEGEVNNNIYLGVNKVVQPGSTRTGTGVCAVGIKYIPEF